MRKLLFGFLLFSCVVRGQSGTVTVMDDGFAKGRMDPRTKGIYELLGAVHYTGSFKIPGKKKYDVVLVMRSVYKDSVLAADTIVNSLPWRKKVMGGFTFDPKEEEATFLGQRVDSMHYRIRFRIGRMNMADRTLVLPWPNHGYMLDEGIRSGGRSVPLEAGRPIPIMVLTQPYPDPPPPKPVVFYRYCFGSETPPEQWPTTYGVPHLFVFELTLVP